MCSPCKDARRIAIEQRLSDEKWDKIADGADPARDRRLRRDFIAALTWVNDACDKNFTRVRSFRNIVLATSAGLVVVAIALGIIGATSPQSLPLCFAPDDVTEMVCPTGGEQGPSGGDAPLVLAVGLTAGAFAAALSVRGIRGTSTPYGVPVAIAWLKLPAGALTALFGMLMVHGQFVPGLSALDTQGQIIAYSIVLGYAQQVFTRLIDSQAHAVLDKAPSSEPAPAPTEPMPARWNDAGRPQLTASTAAIARATAASSPSAAPSASRVEPRHARRDALRLRAGQADLRRRQRRRIALNRRHHRLPTSASTASMIAAVEAGSEPSSRHCATRSCSRSTSR